MLYKYLKYSFLSKITFGRRKVHYVNKSAQYLHQLCRLLVGDTQSVTNRLIQRNISTAHLHEKTFGAYKNKHNGKDIVLVATGPSVKNYKPIKDAIHIGVNRAFMLDKIAFDYLFAQDYKAIQPYIEQMISYRPHECTQFYGFADESFHSWNIVIPESHAIRAHALRYRTDAEDLPFFQSKFAFDIATQPLGCFRSVVFSALQFALWTNPARIYLVGCDVTHSGHFDTNKPNRLETDNIIKHYHMLRNFACCYYPETEIISINPVSLKGLFNDVLQTGDE